MPDWGFQREYDNLSYEKLVPRISNEDKQTISDKTTHHPLIFAGNL